VSADTLEIVEALATLPYRRRAAIVLRYWAGWSDSEIGDALGCRSSNVRVLVHRGLATLRNLLDERGQQQ
jgi:RNA polymerase sigma factor (sigma-70 family)